MSRASFFPVACNSRPCAIPSPATQRLQDACAPIPSDQQPAAMIAGHVAPSQPRRLLPSGYGGFVRWLPLAELNPFLNFLYRGFDSSWFYLMQIILILRSIRTFAIKNLSGPSYQEFCLRWTIGWLKSIVTWFYRIIYRNFICLIRHYSLIKSSIC